MAGSYSHAVDDHGKLLVPEELVQMLENPGDWIEFAEEVYGMIWYLANELSSAEGHHTASTFVEDAQFAYKSGLEHSPGIDGSNTTDE